MTKIYSALIKKNSNAENPDIVLLSEGFSFAAFFFSILWFLYHRMWRESVALVVINIVFVWFGQISSSFDKMILEFFFIFIVALNANYWLFEHLKKRGYEFVGFVFGQDQTDAELRFAKSFRVA